MPPARHMTPHLPPHPLRVPLAMGPFFLAILAYHMMYGTHTSAWIWRVVRRSATACSQADSRADYNIRIRIAAPWIFTRAVQWSTSSPCLREHFPRLLLAFVIYIAISLFGHIVSPNGRRGIATVERHGYVISPMPMRFCRKELDLVNEERIPSNYTSLNDASSSKWSKLRIVSLPSND